MFLCAPLPSTAWDINFSECQETFSFTIPKKKEGKNENSLKMTYFPNKIFKINLNEFIRWIILRVQIINLFMTSIKNLTPKNIFSHKIYGTNGCNWAKNTIMLRLWIARIYPMTLNSQLTKAISNIWHENFIILCYFAYAIMC